MTLANVDEDTAKEWELSGPIFSSFERDRPLRDSFLGSPPIPKWGSDAALKVKFDRKSMEVFRSTNPSQFIAIKVRHTDSILKIKQRIEYQESISIGQQRILVGGRERDDSVIVNDLPADACGPFRLVVVDPIHIWIQRRDGSRFSLTVNQDDLISEVEAQIQAHLGIPPDSQRIFLGWRKLFRASSLGRSSIEDGMTLHLKIDGDETATGAHSENQSAFLHLTVHDLDRKVIVPMTVRRNDVIGDAIGKFEWLDATRPLSRGPASLWFVGAKLPADKTFEDCAIPNGAVLHLAPRRDECLLL
jgi:hypothetical protein